MLLAEPSDDVDVVEEVALYPLRNLEDGEWETGRCWRRHCQVKAGGGQNATMMQLDLCVSDGCLYEKKESGRYQFMLWGKS